jgi:hypothetical protein
MWGQQVDGAFLFAIDPLHDEAWSIMVTHRGDIYTDSLKKEIKEHYTNQRERILSAEHAWWTPLRCSLSTHTHTLKVQI